MTINELAEEAIQYIKFNRVEVQYYAAPDAPAWVKELVLYAHDKRTYSLSHISCEVVDALNNVADDDSVLCRVYEALQSRLADLKEG